MRPEQVAEVHPVELVAGEDEVMVAGDLQEIAQVLAHGVGGALIPGGALGGLLRGEDLHKAALEK